MRDPKITGQEYFWLGPINEKKYLVYKMQTDRGRYYTTGDYIKLDPDYSEWSVRIFDPRCRSLSFINRTLAILPKSKLRAVHKLIGAYLDDIIPQHPDKT